MGARRMDSETARLMDKVRAMRITLGIPRDKAAATAGMDRTHWSHVETGGRGATVSTVERMASAVGLRVDVVPADDVARVVLVRHPDSCAEIPDAEPLPARLPRRETTPLVHGFMARIKSCREALGLTHEQAGERVGWRKSTWGNLERGYAVGQSVSVDRLYQAASAVGLQLDLVAEHHAPLLALDPDEVIAVRGLVRWYLDHAGHRRNAVLAGVAEKWQAEHTERVEQAA